jgi:PilZ domain
MAEGPKAEWFQAQALKCIGLALRAKDYLIRTEYRGVERRINPRHLVRVSGALLREHDSLVDCTVRDFSPAGVGLWLPDTVSVPAEVDLTFNHLTRRCTTVWRHSERMGLKFKSTY